MSEFFNVPEIKYEGPKSKNPLAFKYYDKDRVIMGKKMSEHLKFAMAWWHNLCACGTVHHRSPHRAHCPQAGRDHV